MNIQIKVISAKFFSLTSKLEYFTELIEPLLIIQAAIKIG